MTARAARAAAACALVACASATLAVAASPAAADRSHRVVFSIQPAEVDESSSLVVSTTHRGLVYTANDSGGSATVYVLDARTGKLVGRTDLAGVDPLDIEAMAAGSDGSLVVADIGDNDADRPQTAAYRIEQPGRGTHVVAADEVSLRLSNGPRDAEAALYDASSGRLFVVTKQFAGARVYRSPPHVFSRSGAVLHPVARAPDVATDATFVRDESIAVIRTYWTAYYYTIPGWRQVAYADLPLERQGEGIAAAPDGDHVWVGSEGEHSRVLSSPIPDLTPPAPTTPTATLTTAPPSAPAAGDAVPDDEHSAMLKTRALVVGGVALVLLALVAAIVAFRYHRHPTEP